MRTLIVSPEVYAAIWKRHQPGDRDEDDILRRELGLLSLPEQGATAAIGFYDTRHSVVFPDGFEIHDAKMKHKARAHGGRWHLDDGRTFPTLNQLTEAVGSGDNAWRYWRYRDAETGKTHHIFVMRPSSTSSDKSLEEIGI